MKYTDFMKPEDISVWMCWDVFSKAVIPNVGSEELQYIETRKAYFSGFLECFKIMNDLATELTEEQACKMLNRIQKEIHDFFEEELRPHLDEARK